MNKDFHYYGTYAAARIAGFDGASAGVIAWAAQMVDEVNEEAANKISEEYGISNPVVTSEKMFDNIKDELSHTEDESDGKLQKMRKIWIPFHFLPGDVNPAQELEKGFEQIGKQRNMRDFCCMCKPNSSLVQKMINQKHMFENIIRFEEKNEAILISIGLRMHILADTWAHQNFVGSPNAWINNVSDAQGFKCELDSEKSPNLITNYSVSYLGHGRIGHNPDCPYLHYCYSTPWKAAQINVNNPMRYMNAFCQMVDAMKAIIENNNNFAITIYAQEVMPNEVKDHAPDIMDLLMSEKEDQSEEWMKFIELKLSDNTLPDFDIFQGTDEELKKRRLAAFNVAAGIQQKMVIEHVNQRVPEYFK